MLQGAMSVKAEHKYVDEIVPRAHGVSISAYFNINGTSQFCSMWSKFFSEVLKKMSCRS
jgi:hypothetical protein